MWLSLESLGARFSRHSSDRYALSLTINPLRPSVVPREQSKCGAASMGKRGAVLRGGALLGGVAVGAVILTPASAFAASQVANNFASPSPLNPGYLQLTFWQDAAHPEAGRNVERRGWWNIRVDRYFGIPGTNSCNYQARIDRYSNGVFQTHNDSSFNGGCSSNSNPVGIYFTFPGYGDSPSNHNHYDAHTTDFWIYWKDGYTTNGDFQKGINHNNF